MTKSPPIDKQKSRHSKVVASSGQPGMFRKLEITSISIGSGRKKLEKLSLDVSLSIVPEYVTGYTRNLLSPPNANMN